MKQTVYTFQRINASSRQTLYLRNSVVVGLPSLLQQPLCIIDIRSQCSILLPLLIRSIQRKLCLQAHKGVDAQLQQGGENALRLLVISVASGEGASYQPAFNDPVAPVGGASVVGAGEVG